MTPRFNLPVMSVWDFDNDGHDDLAVIIYIGSGTGVSIWELHVVDIPSGEYLSEDSSNKNFLVENPRFFADHCFTQDNYLSQLDKLIKFRAYKKAGELIGNIRIGNKTSIISINKYIPSDTKFDFKEGLTYGDNVDFYIEGRKIKAKFTIGVMNTTYPIPSFIGYAYADVEYNKGKFTLRNLQFRGNKEF